MGNDQSNILGIPTKSVQEKPKARLNDIVVVSKQAEKNDKAADEDMELLKNLKLSKPILSFTEEMYQDIPRINFAPISEMVLRYQFHLTECSEAVSFDQNVLTKRIKEVDSFALANYKNLHERQKSIDHVISQIIKVTEVMNLLERIAINLENVKLQFKNLNERLPENERIIDPEIT